MDDYKYMVCTRCMTFNHAPYIEDTLNGFSMQETTSPVVFAIVDDASTDGEPEVIKKWCEKNLALNEDDVAYSKSLEYGSLLFARHKEHKNLFFVVLLLSFNHYSKRLFDLKVKYIQEWMDKAKYWAICEGDDYWIDSHKLEKQYNFLNEHKEYSMCFHNTKMLFENTEGCVPDGVTNDGQVCADTLFLRWTVPTASIMYRNGADLYETKGNHRILYGDIMLILKCAESGKIWGMKEEMSVYRVHSDSAIHNKKKVDRDRFKEPQNTKFILDNFNCVSRRLVRKRLGDDYFVCFCRSPRFSFESMKYLLLSVYYNPRFLLFFLKKSKRIICKS